jgi:hypothetical protein
MDNVDGEIMWNMHTNATVDANGDTATLTLGGETLTAKIVQGPSGHVILDQDLSSRVDHSDASLERTMRESAMVHQQGLS